MANQTTFSRVARESIGEVRWNQTQEAGDTTELTVACCWVAGGGVLTALVLFLGADWCVTAGTAAVNSLVQLVSDAGGQLCVRGVCGGF